MPSFDYSLDFKTINFREHSELYVIGRGEQGVLLVEPYKSELLPLWRFRTPQIAEESSKKIYKQYLKYKKEKDFIGMDMARKFLQMGFTRARRYANHPSGKKYSDITRIDPKKININNAFSEKNILHSIKTATKTELPQSEDWDNNEKAISAKIFYAVYKKVMEDAEYQLMKKDHKKKYY